MKLSLFSVSYAGFWGQHALDLHAFLAKAAALGYQAVMLAGKRPHLSPLDFSTEQLHQVRAALVQHQLECAVVAGYTDLSPTAAAEVPYLELQISYVESLSRLADALGARVVRVFTAYEQAGRSPHTSWNEVVRVLQEMCDRAASYGVTIAVQNHHDLAVDSEALLELLQDIDRANCRLGFDAWSPALRGEDLFESAARLAPFTAITTNADYVRLKRFAYQPQLVNYRSLEPDLVRAVPFGTGCIDYRAFFQGLQAGGFDGIASYEICSPIRGGGSEENLDQCARTYLEWMNENCPAASPET
jgi:sugar phosphate isomerase/epimerase